MSVSNLVKLLVFGMVISLHAIELKERFKIVPRFQNVEKFFLNVREHNKKSINERPTANPGRNLKGQICYSILSSGMLSMSDLKPVKAEKWTSLWDLKVSNSEFLKHLQVEEGLIKKAPFQFPIKPRIIRLKSSDDEIVDNAFVCIGLMYNVNYEAYYVSDELNLSFVPEKYIGGRFVFRKETLNSEAMSVVFVAREPAAVIEALLDQVEALYFEDRKNSVAAEETKNDHSVTAEETKNDHSVTAGETEKDHSVTAGETENDHSATAEETKNDPICKLAAFELVQICSSVLNSTYFEGKVKYSDMEAGCVQKEVASRTTLERNTAKSDKEWAVWCPAEVLNKKYVDPLTAYFVLRGNSPENFFVCSGSLESEFCYLENLSANFAVSY